MRNTIGCYLKAVPRIKKDGYSDEESILNVIGDAVKDALNKDGENHDE